MIQLVFKRREIKYLLDDVQRACLEQLMARHMTPDEHGPATICNVYYDTPTLLLARRSAEHPDYKEKLRCRSYGVHDGASPVFVELKKKCDGVVYKRRATLAPAAAAALLAGRGTPQSQIERELDFAIRRYEGLRPTAWLAYDREAFYDPANRDFRLTLDRRVRVRWDHLSLAAPDFGTQILPEGISILEAKTTGSLPLWLVSFLSEEGLRKASWSKYGTACRLRVDELGLAAVGQNIVPSPAPRHLRNTEKPQTTGLVATC